MTCVSSAGKESSTSPRCRRVMMTSSPASRFEVGDIQLKGSSTGNQTFLSAGFSLSRKWSARSTLTSEALTADPAPTPRTFWRTCSAI